jgi:hypothetical protein
MRGRVLSSGSGWADGALIQEGLRRGREGLFQSGEFFDTLKEPYLLHCGQMIEGELSLRNDSDCGND